ncbi:hypothetical protein DPMN_155787, partial [Dreissena polymorpha]
MGIASLFDTCYLQRGLYTRLLRTKLLYELSLRHVPSRKLIVRRVFLMPRWVQGGKWFLYTYESIVKGLTVNAPRSLSFSSQNSCLDKQEKQYTAYFLYIWLLRAKLPYELSLRQWILLNVSSMPRWIQDGKWFLYTRQKLHA